MYCYIEATRKEILSNNNSVRDLREAISTPENLEADLDSKKTKIITHLDSVDQEFLGFCCVMIQKNVRGFISRRLHRKVIKKIIRF